jgi:hypothetical protein
MSKPFDANLIKRLWSSSMNINFIDVLRHFSESQDDKYLEEWDLYFTGEAITDTDRNKFCICSHDIEQCYYVKNRNNGNILRIGSDCIQKFMPAELNREFKEKIRRENQLNRIENGENAKRWCSGCQKHNIMPEQPDWIKLCKKCWKSGNEVQESISDKHFNRQCSVCQKYNIPNGEPEWKRKCNSCWRENKEMGIEEMTVRKDSRQCIVCKKYNIPVDKPEWNKKCYPCYKNN